MYHSIKEIFEPEGLKNLSNIIFTKGFGLTFDSTNAPDPEHQYFSDEDIPAIEKIIFSGIEGSNLIRKNKDGVVYRTPITNVGPYQGVGDTMLADRDNLIAGIKINFVEEDRVIQAMTATYSLDKRRFTADTVLTAEDFKKSGELAIVDCIVKAIGGDWHHLFRPASELSEKECKEMETEGDYLLSLYNPTVEVVIIVTDVTNLQPKVSEEEI